MEKLKQHHLNELIRNCAWAIVDAQILRDSLKEDISELEDDIKKASQYLQELKKEYK